MADPSAVESAFYHELDAFCVDMLGARLEKSSVYELDSTTLEKFSKHVLLKALSSAGSSASCTSLAFASNRQAGRFVQVFEDWLGVRRCQGHTEANMLFFKSEASSAIAHPHHPAVHANTKEVSLVDQSVYSRISV